VCEGGERGFLTLPSTSSSSSKEQVIPITVPKKHRIQVQFSSFQVLVAVLVLKIRPSSGPLQDNPDPN
jgi:hypothetical protein